MTTLIGTNPDQIPVNSMLGGMAYQDPDSVSVKDLSSSGTANITDVSYSGTLTGGTGIINIGSGQVYKDASGKVGLNTTSPLSLLHLNQGTSGDGLRFERSGYDVMDIELSENGLRVRNETDGRTDLLINGTGDLSLFGTGATKIQEGTTAQRPSTPAEGMIRKNSTDGTIEGYTNGSWEQLNGGSLINTTLYSTAGDFVFTKNPRTKKLLVKMIGGGGSGATAVAGPHPAGWASAGGAGSPGTYVEFLLNATQSSYSVRVGAGGAAPSGAGQNGNDGQTSMFSEDGSFVTNHIQSGYGTGGLVIAAAPTPILGGVGNGSIPPSRSGVPSWKILSSCTAQPANWLILNSAWVTPINGNVNTDGKVLPPMSVFGPPMVLTSPCGAGGMGGFVVTGLGSTAAYSGERGAVLIYEYA